MKIALIGNGKGGEIAEYYLTHTPSEVPKITFFKDTDIIPKGYKVLITFSKNMKRRREVYAQHVGKCTSLILSNIKCEVGECNFIFNNVTAGFKAKIGNNNVISSGVIINHHCTIGDGNLIGPGTVMAGSVTIGDNCNIGAGVTFEPGISIGDNSRIVSGANVVQSLPKDSVRKAKVYNGVITDFIC